MVTLVAVMMLFAVTRILVAAVYVLLSAVSN
jgi:hypothetical protein